jgi:hypothetical protein
MVLLERLDLGLLFLERLLERLRFLAELAEAGLGLLAGKRFSWMARIDFVACLLESFDLTGGSFLFSSFSKRLATWGPFNGFD